MKQGKKQVESVSATIGVLIENCYKLKQLSKKIEDKKIFSEIEESIENIELEIKNLQDFIIEYKTESISSIYKKLQEKNHNLKIEGQNSKIDRFTSEESFKIVEKITDKLNQKSKNNEEIKIKSVNTDKNLIIEITTDKILLDLDHILIEAIDKKIITDENADKLSEKESFLLLLEPKMKENSFGEIKEISEKINASLDINPIQDGKISIKVTIPFSATMDGLDVTINNIDYIVPGQNIKESVDGKIAKVDHIGDSSRAGLLTMRDEAIPIVDLGYEFKIREKVSDIKNHNLLVVENEDKKIAFIIDKFGEKHSIVTESTKNYGPIFGISDGTIRGDGRIVFIIKIEDFFKKN